MERILKKAVLFWAAIFCLAVLPVFAEESTAPKGRALEILRMAREASRGVQVESEERENLERELAEAEAEAGDLQAALAIVLKNPKYRDLLLSKIAISQANSGDTKAALKTLEEIKVPRLRVEAYVGVALAYNKVGLSVKTENTFEEALEEAIESKDRAEKTEMLKIIAKGQADVGDSRGAYLTFNRIPDPKERALILTRMVKNQIESGNFKLAREIADVIEYGDNRSAAYKYLAIGLARKKGFTEALEAVASITDDYYKGSAYAKVAEIQAKAGYANEARDTFYRAKQVAKGIRDDLTSQAMILNDIAQAQWFAGSQQDSKVSFQEAEQAGRAIKDIIEKSLVLRDIALAQWSCGQRKESKETFQEARRAALSIPLEDKQHNRAIALKVLAEGMTQAGDLTGAADVIQEAKKAVVGGQGTAHEKSFLLTTMANSEIEGQNLGAAVPLLQQAAQLGQTIPDPLLKALSLTDIAIYQSRAGDQTGALQTLQKAQQAAYQIPDELQKIPALMNITISYIRLGYIDAALQITNTARDEAHKAEMLGRITSTQVQEGEYDEAVKFAQDQSSPLYRTKALLGIAQGLLEQAGTQKTPAVVAQAVQKDEDEGASETSHNRLVVLEGDEYDGG